MTMIFSVVLVATTLVAAANASQTHDKLFKPLTCNQNIQQQECRPWSSYFGSSNTSLFEYTNKVIVPCGECVILDPLSEEYHSNSNIEYIMYDGLSIQGRLLIPNVGNPNSNKIKLLTKSIEVEGILSIYEGTDAEQIHDGGGGGEPITGEVNLEIHLFGGEDGERYLIPHEENSHVCSQDNGCKIGKLPFAVAGGQLDVHAMPKIDEGGRDCPTWTDLLEVSTGGAPSPEEYPRAPSLPIDCSDTSSIVSFNSQSSDWFDYWDVTGSSLPTLEIDEFDNSLLIKGRTKSTQGIRVKISESSSPCQQLQADVPYLVSAKIKVSALDGYGPSSCQTNGKCLYMQLQKVGRYNKSIYRTIPLSKYWPKTTDGEYFILRTVFELSQAEVDDVEKYNGSFYLLLMGVPAPGYNINVQETEVTMATPELYPDPQNVCQNLIVNGDFETGQYYPWKPRSGGSFLIKEEDENKYLRHAGRTSVYPGLEQTLVTGCLEKDVLYEFSMKVRVDTSAGGSLVLKLAITSPSGSVKYRDFLRASKQYDSDGWVTLTKTFSVTDEMATATDVKLITMVGEGSPANTVDYDDIKIVFKQGVGQELLVDNPDIASCWGQGAELFISPSTNQYTDSTVVNIVDVSSRLYQGKEVGVISFEGDVGFHPTYYDQNPLTRAEVALLSRNVMVTATPDPSNELHGGHLIILHTPNVQQHLEGVQFKQMGQQGNLGRYPIHFHLSHNVSGSTVKANSIIESNQRCIVIHGSNEVLIESNVAYNTKGHCFMTEDGNEFGNVFQYNLGAQTLPVEKANLLSSVDSDHNPSTYWMPSPRNSLIGNVAAGSKGSGYWFEVEGFFRGASKNAPEVVDGSLPLPSRQDLAPYLFDGNKAHSNEGDGMQTYPSGGWKPPNEAIFSNFVSYRNRGAGAFSHNGLNQTFIGGYYADNQRHGIDIDRSYEGRIEDVTVVGYSAEYEALVQSPSNEQGIQALSSCGYDNYVQRGIQLHAAKMGGKNLGYQLLNVTFERFGSSTSCSDMAAIDVDSREDSGYFDPRASISNIKYNDVEEQSQINLCDSQEAGVDYIHIVSDGGYIVSDNLLWTTFPQECSPLAGGEACAQFCSNSCVRSLKIYVPSASTPPSTVLKVVDTSTNKSIQVSGKWESHMNSHSEFYMLSAHYRLYLPVGGSYVASFSDSETGTGVWPQYVDTIYEDTNPDGCGGVPLNYVYDGSNDPKSCDELIQTGDGAWLHSGGGVYNISDGDGTWYLENKDRDSWANGLVTYLDTRCFDVGAVYHFMAQVMLTDEDGNSLDCDPSVRKCPVIRMNSSGGLFGTTTKYNEFFTFTEWSSNIWNTIDATITISEEEAEKTKSMIHIYGASDAWSLRIKDISLMKIN